ncbi:MAG: universal stress protein [Candidatus Methanoperedens sp.]|nr:universal stress protein [Candidatus Methanoperedens sp.]
MWGKITNDLYKKILIATDGSDNTEKPAKEILRLAEEQSFDLIVMGTLGKSKIEKILLGSVEDNVIRGSRIPVLTVRK